LRTPPHGLYIVLANALLVSCDRRDPVSYEAGPVTEWPACGAVPGGGHYSAATQITRDNVHALQQASVYRSGDMREMGPGTLDARPIAVDAVRLRARRQDHPRAGAGVHFGMPQEPKGDCLIGFALPAREGSQQAR